MPAPRWLKASENGDFPRFYAKSATRRLPENISIDPHLAYHQLAAQAGQNHELFGANQGVFRDISLSRGTVVSIRWSEWGGFPGILAQWIRSIRFKKPHPNGVEL